MKHEIVNEFVEYMASLTNEEREEVLGIIHTNFCEYCGTKTGPRETCYCWNDK